LSKKARKKLSLSGILDEDTSNLDINSSSIRGSDLLLILSDEGGLPLYTQAIHVDKRTGAIKNRDNDLSLNAKNEQILLMTGFIEAIMQLKGIVRPTLLQISQDGNLKTPLYVDYAKDPSNGLSLVSISTSPEFQQLPTSLLDQFPVFQNDLEKYGYEKFESDFEQALVEPLNEDAAIYWKILKQIRNDLAEFVSFILVYDKNGNYLFSTSKNDKQFIVSDPLLESISHYIKNEYIGRRFKNNLSLIGVKKLSSSIIWHFKCFDRIIVFFTYLIPDMYDFEMLKSEMINYLCNNLEKFIRATQSHPKNPSKVKKDLTSSHFIFLP